MDKKTEELKKTLKITDTKLKDEECLYANVNFKNNMPDSSNIEKNNYSKRERGIDEIQTGDYLSFFVLSKDDYVLHKIVEDNNRYYLEEVETNKKLKNDFDSLEEIEDNIDEYIHIYYVSKNKEDEETNNFLIYDDGMGGDYEVSIICDTSNKYKVLTSAEHEYVYDDDFNTLEEAKIQLKSDYKLVLPLRYSSYSW